MTWLFITVISVSVVFIPTIIIVISIAPGGIPQEAMRAVKTFCGLNCAHRGLYTEDQSIPENSLAAFRTARERGYGVELDIQLTLDEKVVVFHDHYLDRICGVHKTISELSYDELSELHLFNTQERIPLLTEALEVLGDTPVIVELKPSGKRNARLCEKTYEIMREHSQNWCIESFDPRICSWFKKNAPDILRGQLSCPPREYVGISKTSSVVLGNLLLNSLARPHFVAYKHEPYPLMVKLCMKMGPIKAIWTVNPEHDIKRLERENDIIIFEHYMPAPRFR